MRLTIGGVPCKKSAINPVTIIIGVDAISNKREYVLNGRKSTKAILPTSLENIVKYRYPITYTAKAKLTNVRALSQLCIHMRCIMTLMTITRPTTKRI